MVSTPSTKPRRLFEIGTSMRNPVGRSFFKLMSRPIDSLLGLRVLNRHYEHYQLHPEEYSESFFADALRVLKIRYRVVDEELARIPEKGPVFVVANHPFGGVDGIILCELLQKVRPDFRILANYILNSIEEVREWMIAVDPFEGPEAATRNARPLREALRWLKEGHCLATFPAGEVSHLHLRSRKVEDPDWNTIPARIIRRTGATVVPIYFAGGNSRLFNTLGLIHPRMRTLLLARELTRKNQSEITLRIGKPILPRRVAEFEDEDALTRFLRLRTYLLARADEEAPREKKVRRFPPPLKRLGKPAPAKMEPIAEAAARSEVEAAVAALPEDSLLYTKGEFEIYHAVGKDMPLLLREIGRLREITFRDVHEGTGKPLDIDRFDEYYIQLFLWDREHKEIVGAYRMGQTDVILPRKRRQGFYTNTLFKYRTAFIEDLNPALEMGRSFIRPEYQRKGTNLALIWLGIGAYLARNPRYRVLFGPVSMNCDYTPTSRDLIIRFLSDQNTLPEMAQRVKAKTPPSRKGHLTRLENDVFDPADHNASDISAMVSEIERDGKGMPTLMRHYLKLNGRFIAFNIDPDFGDVLDGLIIVDMIKGEPKVMQKFFGKESIWKIYEYYGADTTLLDPPEKKGGDRQPET